MENKENFKYEPELYDLQVNWPARLAKEKGFFEKILKERKIKRILDVGCGTGHHVRLFSEIIAAQASSKQQPENYSITGIDPDGDMINYARESVVQDRNTRLITGGFENLENLICGQFELITCLGNTLALLGGRRKVKMALKAARKKLAKGGIALFQFLNFEPEVIGKKRFYEPKTFRKDGYNYITMKHFEYGKTRTIADFIRIQIDASGNIVDFSTHTSHMCTLRKNMFLKMAGNAGFKKVELLSPGGEEDFDKNKHLSLIAVLYI